MAIIYPYKLNFKKMSTPQLKQRARVLRRKIISESDYMKNTICQSIMESTARKIRIHTHEFYTVVEALADRAVI